MHTFSTHKGFTLVETLVAISVLVLAITGAFTAAQNGINSSIFSKDQIIAFYLAAEGVEQIRNIRDEDTLTSQNWLTGIAADPSDPCYFGKACTVDTVNTGVNNGLAVCPSGPGTCPALKEDPVTGFYGYTSSWPDTTFRREITLTQIVQDHEVAITVTVYWSKGVVNRQFRVRENILNWQ
ncbi:MAG: seg [Parcubacteria group bacterium]|nr:seg [Parcubacteria group bacterium]